MPGQIHLASRVSPGQQRFLNPRQVPSSPQQANRLYNVSNGP
jgi:hypothetical protein